MVTNSLIHFAALLAAIIALFGETIVKSPSGQKRITWLGWTALLVALVTLILQMVVTKKNEIAAEEHAYKLANILSNSGQIVKQAQKLEKNLDLATYHTKIASQKAIQLNSDMEVVLKKNNKYLEAAVNTAVKATEKDLKRIVANTQSTLENSFAMATTDLKNKINDVVSEDEIRRLLSVSVERKLEAVQRELDGIIRDMNTMQRSLKTELTGVIRDIDSMQKTLQRKNDQLQRSSDTMEKNIRQEIVELKRDLERQLSSQSQEQKSITRSLNSMEREIDSIGRNISQLERSIK